MAQMTIASFINHTHRMAEYAEKAAAKAKDPLERGGLPTQRPF